MPGFEVVPWFGVVAPVGTPTPIVQRLHTELQAILSSPDVKNQLNDQGAEAVTVGPEPFARFIRAEVSRWGELIRQAGVKVDSGLRCLSSVQKKKPAPVKTQLK